MFTSEDPRKPELIEDIVARSRKVVPPEGAAEVERFIRKYFGLVAPDDIVYTHPETLLGSALSLWALGRDREPGVSNVRLYNPTLEREGWDLEHTVVEVVNDDMPFLVDSVTAEFGRDDRLVHLVIHPVIEVTRDAEGHRLGTGPADGGTTLAESYMHIEIDQETDSHELDKIRVRVEKVLEDVRAAVADFQPMRQKLSEAIAELDAAHVPISEDELAESEEFLRWLDDDNFVFLGYRRYRFTTDEGNDYLQVEPGTGLGILREVRPESARRGSVPFSEEFSRFARRKELLIVAKANTHSTVHRPVHMDRISIKRFDQQGQVEGEHRFLGLFTSAAYSRSVKFIPMLRHKVSRIIDRAGLNPAGHAGKALAQILETLPRDELLQVSEDELFEISLGVLQLQERKRIALFVRRDVFDRFVSCLVYVPRERYASDLVEKIGAILETAYQGSVSAFYTQMTDSPLARAHFIVRTTPGEVPEIDVKRIEALIAEAARDWADHLRDALTRHFGEDRGLEVYRRFREAFPSAYRERFGAASAIDDIERIDRILGTDELDIDLYEQMSEESGGAMELRCKFIHVGTPLALSDVVPRLENMGLRVKMAVPYELRLTELPEPVRIRDFALVTPNDVRLNLQALKANFEEAFLRTWSGDTEDDGFNRLVICGGLQWQEIIILRAYCKYLRQIGTSFSESTMQQALAANPRITRLLVDLFMIRFDPARPENERLAASGIREQIESELDAVNSVDEDRVLRAYLNLIDSTLRTNYFQPDAEGRRKTWLSFKFDSHAIKNMPLPRPMFEIFVYSPRFEAVHLRGGKVARGGLRWSDRREDFRTEILGLVKAQMVKNAVIVPVGSKGGFVLKQAPPPAQREEFLREGIACYRDFLRGLLDLTDNLVDGNVVPPRDVVRIDEDDTYLVVAADKGTATFSDYANQVSAEYGFWLGDAFASGGSVGYDHKKMGITARGAWEAVKRHFRELGMNTQEEDFTVAGVGDMSGDVFGNGMLLSRHIRLIGAFNHLHIFVDPDPDPEASFRERERLFSLPRSSWSDYDPSVLSAGGAVFERTAKSITVSEQVRERFDLPELTTTPVDLMQAILRARADLLWLGGIGTYVKANDESQADARDRANDPLRVDASELRVRVVGEGANLGLTQRGRIEFALSGGKINTDAIDNSAGVDTSDHEVNIKILLDEAIRRGGLNAEHRNELLAEMTDEVGHLVLRDNYQQTQAISVAEAEGLAVLDQQARLMRSLERSGRLDRHLETLPDEETIAERQVAHVGLTRPELAVLLAYAKIAVYQELLDSDLPDDPLLVEDLFLYFPQRLRGEFSLLVPEHRLRREIIATYVTNSMVNRVGPSFVSHMFDETGRSASDIARAYTISRDSFAVRNTWIEIESLDNKVPASLQTSMMIEVGRLVERATRWFLRGDEALDISANFQRFHPGISTLEENLDDLLPEEELADLRQRTSDRKMLGIPEHLARRLASLDILGSFLDIVRIATSTNKDVQEVGRVYFLIGARFDFDRLRNQAAALAADSAWQRAAIEGLVDDFFAYQSMLVSRILSDADRSPAAAVDRWFVLRPDLLARTDQLLTEIRSAPLIDLSVLTVASRQFRTLAQT